MKCKNCGTKIAVGTVYCEKCGKEVQIVPDFNVLDDEIESAISISEVVNSEEPLKNLIPRDSLSNIKIASIIAVCIFLVIVIFVFGGIYSKHEKSFDYQYEKAERLREDGNNTSALECYNKALNLDPIQDGTVYKSIAKTYIAMNNLNKAEECYLSAIDQNPLDTEPFEYLIKYYSELDDYVKLENLRGLAISDDVYNLFSTLIVPTPMFSIEPGTYNGIRTVEIVVEGNFPIYYTIDKEEPTVATGLLYKGPIELEIGTTVIRAVAYDEARGDYGKEISGDFTITVKAPLGATAEPAGGHFTEPTYVTLSTDTQAEDCRIFYTFDGTAPTEQSFEYTGPFLLPLGENKLSVAVINGYGIRSEIFTYDFYYGAD